MKNEKEKSKEKEAYGRKRNPFKMLKIYPKDT